MTQGKIKVGAIGILLLLLLGNKIYDGQKTERPLYSTTLGQAINAIATDTRIGRIFVAAGRPDGSGRLYMLDARTGRLLQTITMSINRIHHQHDAPVILAVDDRTHRLFVGRTGNSISSISIVDTRTGRVLRTVAIALYPTAMAVDARTGHLFVGSSGWAARAGQFTILDGTTGRAIHAAALPRGEVALALDTHDGYVIIASYVIQGKTDLTRVRVQDMQTGRLVHALLLPGRPAWRSLVVDERRDRAFVLTTGSLLSNFGHLYMLDIAHGRLLRSLPLSDRPEAVVEDGIRGRIFVSSIGPARLLATTNPTGLVQMVPGQRGLRNSRAAPLPLTSFPTGPGRIQMYDARTAALQQTTLVGIAPQDIIVDERSGDVFSANMGSLDRYEWFSGPGTVSVLNPALGRVVRTVTVGTGAGLFALDERTRHLFVINRGGGRGTPDNVLPWAPEFVRHAFGLPPRSQGGAFPVPSSASMINVS